jgi:hypothetical protein
VVVRAAEAAGYGFIIHPDRRGFTLELKGPREALIDEAISDNYDAVLAWLIAQGVAEGEGEQPAHEDGPRANGTAASSSAPAAKVALPFMITREMKRKLRDRGLTDAEIANLTPGEARAILASGIPPKTEKDDKPGDEGAGP